MTALGFLRVSPSLMLFLCILSAAVSVISIIPLITASHDKGVLKNIYWASTKDLEGIDTAYIASYNIVLVDEDTTVSVAWDSSTCQLLESTFNAKFCKECKWAHVHFIAYSAVFFCFSWGASALSFIRYTEKFEKLTIWNEFNLQLGILSSNFICILFGVTTVVVFDKTCLSYWPQKVEDYELGSAAVVIIVVVIYKFLEALIHLCSYSASAAVQPLKIVRIGV
jgi:hypothetical protein